MPRPEVFESAPTPQPPVELVALRAWLVALPVPLVARQASLARRPTLPERLRLALGGRRSALADFQSVPGYHRAHSDLIACRPNVTVGFEARRLPWSGPERKH